MVCALGGTAVARFQGAEGVYVSVSARGSLYSMTNMMKGEKNGEGMINYWISTKYNIFRPSRWPWS